MSLRSVIFYNLKLLVILFGAIFALAFAFFAQYVDGYHPCELCLVQRWVYGLIIIAAILAHARIIKANPQKVKLGGTVLTILLALEVAIATYHFGIEQKWWEGFQACSSGLASGLSVDELRNQVAAAPVTRCDQGTWYLLGLSMAGWNVIYSFGLFLISLWSLKSAPVNND